MQRWLFWIVVVVVVVTVVMGIFMYISRPRVPFVSARDLQSVVRSTAAPEPKTAILTVLEDSLSPISFPVLDKYAEKHKYDVLAYPAVDTPEGLLSAVHKTLQNSEFSYDYFFVVDASVLITKLQIPLHSLIQKYLHEETQQLAIPEDCFSRFGCSNVVTAWQTRQKRWLNHSPIETFCMLVQITPTMKRLFEDWNAVFENSAHPCSMERHRGPTFVFQKCVYQDYEKHVSVLPANIWVGQDHLTSASSTPVLGIQSTKPATLEQFKNEIDVPLATYEDLVPRIQEVGAAIVRTH